MGQLDTRKQDLFNESGCHSDKDAVEELLDGLVPEVEKLRKHLPSNMVVIVMFKDDINMILEKTEGAPLMFLVSNNNKHQ